MPRPPPPNAAVAELANGLGIEDARELVRMFLDGFPATLASLAAVEKEERRRAAHSLKSSARIVGLMTLSRQMAEIENRFSKETGDVVPEDIVAAQTKFDTAAPALRAFAALD